LKKPSLEGGDLVNKSFFQGAILVVLAICSLTRAQQKVEPPAAPIKELRIPLVRITPSPKVPPPVDLSSPTNKTPISGGGPLGAPRWNDRMDELRRSGITGLPPAPPRSLHLSPAAPIVRDSGWLDFYCNNVCVSVVNENAMSFRNNAGRGSAILTVSLVRGGRYLLDFNVNAPLRSGADITTFRATVVGRDEEFRFTVHHGPQRISLVLDSTATGYAQIYLGADIGLWEFYSVDMMRLDDGGR
jgi:hypothetical protein